MKLITVVTALIMLSGCASIVSKSSYDIAVNSKPSNVEFTVTDRKGREVAQGTTPEIIRLRASAGYFTPEDYTVVFSKSGYRNREVRVRSTLDGWYFGNVLIGGLLGILVIDPLTGALFKLPDNIDATLNELTANVVPGSLSIVNYDDLSNGQRERLIALDRF